ncbi:hypothetical protein Nocox_16585 [Nonomuraea coxensis DSM 45129]|uniref:Uncharacterized protein n=1 Tax=Nonomuraea coxensis DSM 45129 TaxID=1122611 RepID=A0ABX8TZK3_9ACTN|nr:hypothetical protein [Nonomuraea coxensis]QYC40930.1 hypothetical protein Nocox_16585 [Nonomuraea coxensis DSM 45129]
MRYVNLSATIGGISDVLDPQPYLDRLPELRAALPEGAAAYAGEPGHYDFTSPRCVHDLKLDRILFGEDDGDGGGDGWMRLGFRHNCWKHEEDLTLHYTGVTGYALRGESDMPLATRLGEVVLDEVLPHPDGCAHEIACHTGSVVIVCRDLTATWSEAGCRRVRRGRDRGA